MRCEEFIDQLEQRDLQEGGSWPPDLERHARDCPHCRDIHDIFQAISGEIATLPRRTLDADADGAAGSVLVAVHESVPRSSLRRSLRRALIVASAGATAAFLLVIVPAMADVLF
jgi:hypothetical protein